MDISGRSGRHHGSHDRITDPGASVRYADRARWGCDSVGFVDVPGDGHGMLRRAGSWNCLVSAAVITMLSSPATGRGDLRGTDRADQTPGEGPE